MASKWFGLSDYITIYSEEETGNFSGTFRNLPRLLSHPQFAICTYVGGLLLSLISLLGVVSNAINVLVFLRMKAKDGVNLSFLGLSASDLMSSICGLLTGLAIVLFAEELHEGPKFNMDPFVLRVFSANLANMGYTITALLTLFIAITRCMCVARPLQFKHMFTAKRSLYVIIFCFAFGILNYLPVLGNMGVIPSFTLAMNRSRPSLWFSPYREVIKDIVHTSTLSVLPFLTTFVLFVCVITMTTVLSKASSFRQNASASHVPVNRNNSTSETSQETVEKSSDGKLSGKELRVVHQVLILSMVYLACTLPQMLFSVATSIMPGVGANPEAHQYARLYYVIQSLRLICVQVNSSVNIFVYLKYNQGFREMLKRKT